jgi:hypothetical protein
MIYVSNTGKSQIISIPRSFYSLHGLRYHLEILQANTAIYATNLADMGGSWLYYNFQINLPGSVSAGEYEYVLKDESDNVLSEGVLVVEWDRPEMKEFEKFVEYEQYEEQ